MCQWAKCCVFCFFFLLLSISFVTHDDTIMMLDEACVTPGLY